MRNFNILGIYILIILILISGFFLPITNIFVTIFSSIIFNLDLIYTSSESMTRYNVLLLEINATPSNVLSSSDSLVSNDEVSHWRPQLPHLSEETSTLISVMAIFCVLFGYVVIKYALFNPRDLPGDIGEATGASLLFLSTIEKTSGKRTLIFLTILLVFAVMSMMITKSAILLLLLLVLLSTAPFLLLIPKRYSGVSYYILELLIKIFNHFGLLTLLFRLYTWLNSTLSFSQYRILTYFLGIILLSFIMLNRYLFLLKLEQQHISIVYLVLYFILLVGVFIRFFFNYSYFIIPLTFTYFPHIGILLTGDIPELPLSDPQITYRGWFNRHTHQYNNYFPPEIPKSNLVRNVGLGIGCVGLCLTTFACYQYYRSANAAVMAALAADRAADVSEVQAGLRTQESYNKKWGKSS